MTGRIPYPEIEVFDSREQLNEIAAARISSMIGAGGCTLFLSGGTTPGPIYDRLSEADLDWEKVYVAPADERWVDDSEAGSNARTIKQTLVKNNAKNVNFVAMKSEHATPHDGELTVEMAYQQLPRPYNLVLGMGADGHIASWFSSAPEYEDMIRCPTKRLVCPMSPRKNDITGDYTSRMTITPNVLHMCENALMIITGQEKYSLLERCLENREKDLPVQHAIEILKSRLTVLAVKQ